MLGLALQRSAGQPLRVLALGAHPDDIEIAAGGTLLQLADSGVDLEVRHAVLTGSAERHDEARAAAREFHGGRQVEVEVHHLPEGRLPAHWAEVKDVVEAIAARYRPDVVLAPSDHDAHQDHRTIAEVVPTVFRDSLYLAYEIPKWDGDMSRPTVYVPMSAEVATRKVELLSKCYPSQRHRDWWSDETFLSLARLRGMECRAPYAEAFLCTKAVLTLSGSDHTRGSAG